MPSPLVIRSAAMAEQAALEALQRRASLANIAYRAALLANPDAIELPLEHIAKGQVFVAERQGAAVGFAVVLGRADGQAELDGLFVEPPLWRQGIGSTLADYSAAHARARGAWWLHVVANPQAEGFYASCGFEPGGTVQTRFGVALLMRKRLA